MIDYAGDGFNLSEEAMNVLTCVHSTLITTLLVFLWFADLGYSDGEAVQLGVVDATAVQVDVSFCGGA